MMTISNKLSDKMIKQLPIQEIDSEQRMAQHDKVDNQPTDNTHVLQNNLQ